jgi:Ca2+-transporting ATPase
MREASIFARVNPKQKLDLIRLHQKNGSVVAMTGDGINDAPALKKADIGVAMGRRGTQVAREAADVVLRDDAFKTIVVAIQQGRAIFDNIRKFILFLLSGNVGEIMIVAFALLAGMPLPILPLQILYLNMIGDVFPALALGVGKGDPSKMRRPPREAKEPILTRQHWAAIVGYGLLIAASVLVAFWMALSSLGMETDRAVTVSFLTLAFARLWHVFNMRDGGSHPINNDVTRNPFVWGALGLCSALLVAALYLPGISTALHMVPPGRNGWPLIFGMSLVPLLFGQALKQLRGRALPGWVRASGY